MSWRHSHAILLALPSRGTLTALRYRLDTRIRTCSGKHYRKASKKKDAPRFIGRSCPDPSSLAMGRSWLFFAAELRQRRAGPCNVFFSMGSQAIQNSRGFVHANNMRAFRGIDFEILAELCPEFI